MTRPLRSGSFTAPELRAMAEVAPGLFLCERADGGHCLVTPHRWHPQQAAGGPALPSTPAAVMPISDFQAGYLLALAQSRPSPPAGAGG